MTDWIISDADVKKHPKYGKMSLDDILFSYGMDTSEGYTRDGRDQKEVEESEEEHFGFTHRSIFTGEIHTCPRYYGTARTDGGWSKFTQKFLATNAI